MPPPLATRPSLGSPVLDNSSVARYPLRKSSLSQQSPLQTTSRMVNSMSIPSDGSPGARPSQISPTTEVEAESEDSSSKPLPFIRPADIYKRIEQERQKERASTDSERPSIELLTQATSADGSARESRSHGSSESLVRPAARRSSAERVSGSSPFTPSRTPLEPVQERRSVYDPYDALVEGAGSGQAVSSAGIPKLASGSVESNATAPTSPRLNFTSSQPMLPEINPSSGFGEDVWAITKNREQTESPQSPTVEMTQPEKVSTDETREIDTADGLQHQPSLGFRSVVNQAFDRHDEQSIPPTPVSSQDQALSRDGSGVSRSNTDSTAGISPIISRATSAAANVRKGQASEVGGNSTPAIAEEPEDLSLKGSRRPSSGSLHGSQHVPRKPSPSHSRQSSSETAKAFVPGYRRSLGPPSSENSPARTPNLEQTKQIPPFETGELSTDPSENSLAAQWDSIQANTQQNEFEGVAADGNRPRTSSNTERTSRSPVSRSESPSKGRVRDLAGKFNDIQSSSDRSSADSLKLKDPSQIADPILSTVANNASTSALDQSVSSIGIKSTPETVRPQLPGGWVSYAPSESSISGIDNFQGSEPAFSQVKSSDLPADTPSSKPGDDSDMKPTTDETSDPAPGAKTAPAGPGSMEGTTNPLTAVTAAESAIAASIVRAAGSKVTTNQDSEAKDSIQSTPEQHIAGGNNIQPLRLEQTLTSTGTSAAPTPLPKDTPPPTASLKDPGYFVAPGPSSIPAPAPMLSHTTTQQPIGDLENERLRNEITRQLDPEAALGNRHEANTIAQGGTEKGLPHLTQKFSWEDDDVTGSSSGQSINSPAEEAREQKKVAEIADGFYAADDAASIEKSLPRQPTESELEEQSPDVETTGGTQPSDRLEDGSGLGDFQRPHPDSPPLSSIAQTNQQAPETVLGSNQPTLTDQSSRIPPFREILAMKVAADRITTYNRTREQFANMNTGLGEWVATTFAANPENAALASPQGRTAPPVITSSIRHKPSPSLMKIGKSPTTGHSQQQSVSSSRDDEEGSAALSSPTKPAQNSTGRVTGQQMQAKGKDLLKNAGALGGKATTGAKGLFAKGRNKLQNRGSDKVDS